MAESIVTPSRRLELAYLAVFGPPDKRSTDQQLVMQDIEGFCHAYRLIVEATDNHALDPLSAILNDGRRSVWLRARGHIIRAQAEPAKPLKISRKRPSNP